MSASERATSHLLKAQEYLRLMESEASNPLRSTAIALAQDSAENAFRAILFARGVMRQGDHRPDRKALEHMSSLRDIWDELEPLISEYEWLWEWRNIGRYKHTDTCDISDPEISPETLRRAGVCARQLVGLAERVVAQ
jgi:hypothetical protein